LIKQTVLLLHTSYLHFNCNDEPGDHSMYMHMHSGWDILNSCAGHPAP